jgi:hypothetical protein
MKLAVAAGILAQTLPVLSEKAVGLIIGQEKKFDLASILASIPREADGSLPHGKARRAHGGRRTQASSFQKQLQGKKTGLLMNMPIAVEDVKPCNPSSKDPDVGILSCGKGKFCEQDENLFLGGKCAPRMVPEGNSIGKSKAFASFGKGGILQNIREAANKAVEGTVECDPAGSADVGILSCGEGKQCLPSTASSMGGFCAPEASSRQLNHLTSEAGICDPTHPDYMYYDCDCSGFDNATGTGDVPCTVFEDYCLGLTYSGCADTCVTRTVDYSFSNFTSPSYSFCFAFETPYAQKVCFEEFFDTDTCAITFNDAPCTTCEFAADGNYTSITFDCVNAGGIAGTTEYGLTELLPIVGACYEETDNPACTLCADSTQFNPYAYDTVVEVPALGAFTCETLFYSSYYYSRIAEAYCPAISAAAAESCCQFYCDLCGTGSYIPTTNWDIELDVPIAGYEGTTCGSLVYAAYFNFTIAADTCPSAGSIAGPCCDVYEISCDLCDGGDLDPTATVTVDGEDIPCQLVTTFVNETDCEDAKALVADTCCIASAPSPSAGPDASPGSPAGAAGLLSTRNLASMVGLAAAAVAFVMN